jgi:hypothetical protein
MEQYNRYIKPSPNYISEIVIINAQPSIIDVKLFWVQFAKDKINFKDNFFLDNKEYLSKIFKKVRFTSNLESDYLKESKGYIKSIQPSTQYYSYIKVIKDIQNPQLEGQIMLFKYGKRIKDIVDNQIIANKRFENILKINVTLASGFHNYDRCYFTDTEMIINDNTLNLESEIKFKTIDIISVERKEKLQRLNSQINYKKILKSIPIEEIKEYLENYIF